MLSIISSSYSTPINSFNKFHASYKSTLTISMGIPDLITSKAVVSLALICSTNAIWFNPIKINSSFF